MDDVREVKLKRSDSIGLGFSVFGGKGSGFPPVVYQVVDESPAAVSGVLEAGDVILEVNDKNVVALTTKEVLKCLRLSNDVVTLKVKKDATVRERVHNHMAASSELEALRRSFVKEKNGVENPKQQERVAASNGNIRENGENIPPPTSPPQPKFESFVMTGELIIKTKSSNFVPPPLKNSVREDAHHPPNKGEDDPKGGRGRTTKREAPESQSPVVEKKSSYSYAGNFVRTSRSEDYLQKTSSSVVSSVNIEVEEEMATSLHNLLDTSSSCKDTLCRDTPSKDTHHNDTSHSDMSQNAMSHENMSHSASSHKDMSHESDSRENNLDEFLPWTNRDTRTGQFIHVPSLSDCDPDLSERLVNDHINTITSNNNNSRSRYAARSSHHDGVTNIVIDENTVYVKVSPEQNHPSSPKNPKSPSGNGSAEDSRRCCSPEDESDVESLSSFHYSPKAIDMPSASRLAKRLFHLEGFKKSDVSRHLCKNNDFSRVVAGEYLQLFDFAGESLDCSLRKFLRQFCLIGETQERERVLIHFSKRFLDCNRGAFKSQDAVHTLTCALMLLNTDLHGENVGRRMTCGEFIENLSELNEGENFSKEVLKSLYHSIRTNALEWAVDDEEEPPENNEHTPNQPDQRQSFVGHNPFLEVPNPNCATEYKRGYVMRKCCVDPNGKKTPMGKRGWKMFYADLRDLVLYLHKDENGVKRNQLYDSLHNAVRVHHALATRASDYAKKQNVFRLQTADRAVYLFQTSDAKELQSWIDTINYVAASLSAPSLEGAVGAQKKFQRPLLPAAPTKLNFREQLLDLESKVIKLEKEIEEHLSHPPDRSAKSRVVNEYVEKEQILQYELKRYRTYIYLLRSKVSQFPELEPPLVESIGEVDEMLEKGEQLHSPPAVAPFLDGANAGKRSLTDRFSYRAAIYRTDNA